LAGLGLLPTAAAAIALVLALAGNASAQAWWVGALGVSVIANLLLAFLAIRGWRYARDLEHDMGLIAERFRPRSPSPPWLPDQTGALSVTNATLEGEYDAASKSVIGAIGEGAVVGPGWISLDQPMLTFHGWNEATQKECRIWIHPGEPPVVLGIERRRSPFHTIRPPIWRDDPSWPELISRSWAVEAPFSGSVTLWPRLHHDVQPGDGLWRIEYTPQAEGVSGRSTTYILRNGALVTSR
jgi:hypothetical protein